MGLRSKRSLTGLIIEGYHVLITLEQEAHNG